MKRLRVLTAVLALASAVATGCTIYLDHDRDPDDGPPWGVPDAGSGGWPSEDAGSYHQDAGPGGCGEDAGYPTWPDASPCGCGEQDAGWPVEQDAGWPVEQDAGSWPGQDAGPAPGYDAGF